MPAAKTVRVSKVKNADPTEFGGPKKPASAYFAYGNSVRQGIMDDLRKKEANGGEKFNVSKVATIIGEQWKVLPAAEKEKFEAEAKASKEEYDAKMAEWKTTEQYKEYQAACSDKSIERKEKQAKAELKASVPDSMPKKPLSAYFAFSSSVTKEVADACAAAGDKSMSARAAKVKEMWNALSEEKRKEYQDNYVKQSEEYKTSYAAWTESEEGKEYLAKKAQSAKDVKAFKKRKLNANKKDDEEGSPQAGEAEE